jgi:hypothetical protein
MHVYGMPILTMACTAGHVDHLGVLGLIEVLLIQGTSSVVISQPPRPTLQVMNAHMPSSIK